MPINAHPDYIFAEREYNQAQTAEEQIKALEKMISLAPSHKGAENLRAQLKTRLKKLKEKISKSKNVGKRGSNSSQISIKKEDMQTVIVGFENSGKSALISLLTNVKTSESPTPFSTKQPIVGMMPFKDTKIQLIENPSINSEGYNRGITNTADVILMMITKIEEIQEIEKVLDKSEGKKIVVFNKTDLLTENEKRKISETLKSKYKKYPFILISTKDASNIKELKEKIFQNFDKIRVYTKEPGKEKSQKPIIMRPESTVKDVAEKILKGFSEKVKETKIWGPSSKFPGQKVGLNHKLKDLDVVEFKTK